MFAPLQIGDHGVPWVRLFGMRMRVRRNNDDDLAVRAYLNAGDFLAGRLDGPNGAGDGGLSKGEGLTRHYPRACQ